MRLGLSCDFLSLRPSLLLREELSKLMFRGTLEVPSNS